MPTPTAQQQSQTSVFRKVANTSLGVMTGASMVLSLTGVPIIGALAQGGVTVAQAALDITDENKSTRATLKTFLSNAVFTVISLIPFVGAAAKTAMAAKGTAEVALTGAGEVGLIGRIGNKINELFSPVTKVFKSAWGGVKNGASRVIERSETLTSAKNGLKSAEATLASKLEGGVSADSRLSRFAVWSSRHHIKTQVLAPMAADMALSAVIGGDKDAGPTVEPEVAGAIKGNTGREWQNRIAAERNPAARTAADLAHAGAAHPR